MEDSGKKEDADARRGEPRRLRKNELWILAEAIVWARDAGREDMARAMRALGRPETEIQQALDRFDRPENGESET